MMKRKQAVAAGLALCLVLCHIPGIRAEAAKDVWIDNTVDNSVSNVKGAIQITGSGGEQAGYKEKQTISDKDFQVTFSTPKPTEVQSEIDAVSKEVYDTATAIKNRGKSGEIHLSTTESTGKVWDNRKYETIEDGDAILIGDTDYITGGYGVPSGDMTRTHIASGDYGKETFYLVEANGWVSGWDIAVTNDGNGTASADLTASLQDETVSITATPNGGYKFKNWEVVSGGASLGSTTAASTSFMMPGADVQLKAVFEQENQEETGDPVEPENPGQSDQPEKPVQNGGQHTHTYEWMVIKQPTVKDDGEKVYACTQCGAVYQGVLLSGYPEFLNDAAARIRSAAPNATVLISTERWISINSTVLDELAKRTDVTLVIEYVDHGAKYRVAIPAGTNPETLKDEQGYAGFRFLAVKFGAAPVQ